MFKLWKLLARRPRRQLAGSAIYDVILGPRTSGAITR